MHKSEFNQFAELLDAVAGMLGREYSGTQKAMFFRALASYSMQQVQAGLDAHVKDPKAGMFLPMPAHIIGRIEGLVADDGRPGEDEAWALAVKAADDQETVVWTTEMQEAWGEAKEVFGLGDEVGARMAFKDAYRRLVQAARRVGRAPTWSASLGYDAERRDAAIEMAARRGQLKREDFPQLQAPDPIALLTFSGPMTDAKAQAIGSLLQLQERMRRQAEGPSHDADQRQRTAALQVELEQRVREYEAAHDTHGGLMNVADLMAIAQKRIHPVEP
jgi:hypothetical protein